MAQPHLSLSGVAAHAFSAEFQARFHYLHDHNIGQSERAITGVNGSLRALDYRLFGVTAVGWGTCFMVGALDVGSSGAPTVHPLPQPRLSKGCRAASGHGAGLRWACGWELSFGGVGALVA
jgi:hypothetical protein